MLYIIHPEESIGNLQITAITPFLRTGLRNYEITLPKVFKMVALTVSGVDQVYVTALQFYFPVGFGNDVQAKSKSQ